MMRLWCEGVVVHIAKGIHGWYEVKNCFLWKGGKKKKNRHTALSTTRGDKKQRFLDLNEQGMPDDIAHG